VFCDDSNEISQSSMLISITKQDNWNFYYVPAFKY
jgi:hypothetical protein